MIDLPPIEFYFLTLPLQFVKKKIEENHDRRLKWTPLKRSGLKSFLNPKTSRGLSCNSLTTRPKYMKSKKVTYAVLYTEFACK